MRYKAMIQRVSDNLHNAAFIVRGNALPLLMAHA